MPTDKTTPRPWTFETVPTSIGHCHKIIPIEACLYVDNQRLPHDAENHASKQALADVTLIVQAVNERDALLAKAALFGEMLAGYYRISKILSPEITSARAIENWHEIESLACDLIRCAEKLNDNYDAIAEKFKELWRKHHCESPPSIFTNFLKAALRDAVEEAVKNTIDNASEWVPNKTRADAYEKAAKAIEYQVGTSLETPFDRALVDGAIAVIRALAQEEK